MKEIDILLGRVKNSPVKEIGDDKNQEYESYVGC